MRVRVAGLAAWFLLACGGDDGPAPPLPEVTDPLPLVDPTIGTGGLGFAYGSSFVGAALPHGLVKLGPDTSGRFGTLAFQHFSGYFAEDDTIEAFTHLHLHGAGVADFGVLAVMPTRASDAAHPRASDYRQKFAKPDEHAGPGRYAVTLADGTTVELLATLHGAHHVYRFAGGGGELVVDLMKTLEGGEVTEAGMTLDATTGTLRGKLHHRGGMSGSYGGYDLFFSARTRRPWTNAVTWGPEGAPTSAALRFTGGEPVELQVAVSLVSAAGADANLAAELPDWDAVAVRARAEAAWRDVLGTVAITGGTAAERRIFYTSLYHGFLMPTVIGDASGDYLLHGMTAPARAEGWRQLSDFSLWDTYRTVHPLYAWLAPASARDSTGSLAAFAELGGCPRWPIAIGESGTMLGASCDIVVADAAVKGISDHVDRIWPLLRAAALDATAPPMGRGGRDQVEPYLALGYVPASVGRSVSHTTEYAHDDFALAQLARTQGDLADADALLARSHGWRLLYDPAVGFLRARNADGGFPDTDFDALELSDDYAEANAWHSLWMASLHDPAGLATLLGGEAAVVDKLERFFDAARLDWDTADASAANFPRPYYWHGNEPDLSAPFLFAQLGRPDLTQTWARWVLSTHYDDTPTGLAGNDDGGTLGAWYVFASLGLYPIAGSDRYVVGAPIFERARITVGGHQLVIEAPGASATHRFVAGLTVDNRAVERAELTHADLTTAAVIHFTMSDKPTTWGRTLP